MSGEVDLSRFATPEYHRRLGAHIRASEPELWAWFRDATESDPAADDEAELQLLKTTYRLDGDVHGVLAGLAPIIAGRLGLEEQVVVHQALGEGERNARVQRLGDTIHIVFSGDLLELLEVTEQEAVLAHELAHVALHRRDGGEHLVLDHLVSRADVESITDDALGETARRLRLHTEVWSDAVALAVIGDPHPVVASVVKVSTGLRNVDPDAYLRQARQIVESDPSSSHGWTHPELHVRVACLAARDTEVADEVVAQLIDGPDDLDRLDLLGQLRLQDLTARALATAASTEDSAADEVRSYLAGYGDLAVASAEALGDGELAGVVPSVRHLCAALLVDVALLGDGQGLNRITAFSTEAERQGVGAEFDKILSRATEQTLAQVRRLRTPA